MGKWQNAVDSGTENQLASLWQHALMKSLCGLPDHAGAGQPSLAEGSPQVAAQWHPSLNDNISLADLTCGSSEKVWWLCTACPCGHEHVWQASVTHRVQSGRGCLCWQTALRLLVPGSLAF